MQQIFILTISMILTSSFVISLGGHKVINSKNVEYSLHDFIRPLMKKYICRRGKRKNILTLNAYFYQLGRLKSKLVKKSVKNESKK